MLLLSKVKSYLPYDAKILFYNFYVIPCLDYSMIVWDYASKMNLDKLFRYQKRIGRLILNYACDSLELFDRLGWLTIYKRRDLIHRRVQRGGGSGGPDPALFLDPPFSSVTPLQPNPISQTNVM